MEKITRYQSDSVFRPQPVASAAEGDAALSEAFGTVAKASVTQAANIMQEQSNFNLMKAASEAHTAYTQSQIDMEKNPGMSQEITGNLDKSFGTIAQYEMNKGDRERYNSLTSTLKDQASLKNAQFQIGLANIAASDMLYDTTTNQLKLLEQQAAVGDLDQVDNTVQMIHDSTEDAVQAGIIQPHAFRSINDTIQQTIGGGLRFHDSLKEGMSAEQAHALNWSPFGTVMDVADLPANHATQTISSHLMDQRVDEQLDRAMMQSDINASPKLPGYYFNMGQHAQAEYLEKMKGIREAYGRIASNGNYAEMEQRVAALSNKDILTTSEQSELKYYQQLEQELNEGKTFWDVMGKTSQGAQAIREYHADLAANGYFSGTEIPASATVAPINTLMHKLVASAQASNMSPHLIKPVPENMMNSISAGFALDADPRSVSSTLSQLDSSNRPYVANQVKNPYQQEVLRSISYGMDNGMTPQTMNDLVVYNQENRKFKSGVKSDEELPVNRNAVEASIVASMPELFSYLKQFPSEVSDTRIKATRTMLSNVVLGRMMRTSDFSDSNKKQVISDLTDEMNKAYNFTSSHNRMINRSQIPLTNPQADNLANFLINVKARDVIGKFVNDHNEVDAYLWKQNLTVINTPENNLLVVDNYGTPIYKTEFTSHLMSEVKEHQREVNKKSAPDKLDVRGKLPD